MSQMHSHTLVPPPKQILERYDLEPELAPHNYGSTSRWGTRGFTPVQVELTNSKHDMLSTIYRRVKGSIAYRPDLPGKDTWGVVTWRWFRGLSGWILRREGDCDDYAVEFLRELLKAGWPRGAMRLARAKLGYNYYHLVLGVDFAEVGTIILDNRQRTLVKFGAFAFSSYEWEICEKIGSKDWARIGEPYPVTLNDLVSSISTKEEIE